MRNPFKLLKPDDHNRQKSLMEKNIKDQAWCITKKVVSKTLATKDIDDLELLYKEYFKTFPDAIRERNCKLRIAKLRKFV